MKTVQEIEKAVNEFNRQSKCLKLSIRRSKVKVAVLNECEIGSILDSNRTTKMKKAVAIILNERGYTNIEISNILSVPPQLSHYYTKSFSFDNFQEKNLYLQIKSKIK